MTTFYYHYSPLLPHMSTYSRPCVFNLLLHFYHPSTLHIWHKHPFQPFISPQIPIAPVSFFRPIISLAYSILYYFDSHLIGTPASASYTVPKFLPTRYPLLSTLLGIPTKMMEMRSLFREFRGLPRHQQPGDFR
jgi:hypothetical protein